jgi:flagellar motor protein MotB
MTTLLLCFFVFLLVTAKVDVDKLSSASGYMAHKMGLLPANTKNDSQQDKEDAEKGVAGDQDQTLSIDEGKKFVLGGKDMFEAGKAVPTKSKDNKNTKELLKFATQVRGMRNIIEVRGHTSSEEVEGTIYRDAMDLSTERARVIRDILISVGKIQSDRIRIVGCGDHEPLRSNLFVDKAQNRRVEIRVNAKYQPFNPNTVIE